MLKIADKWFDSDVGRARQGNEDNFFVRAPVFVVADGMGGAQAGEVASQMAVEEFEPGLPNGDTPEEGLTAIIVRANNKIHEMSHSDTQRSGMGTTCTAVYVDVEEVVIAHVGDSRCYLYRNGELTRLTTDHSLVGELVDRGKLTEEQAEMHPQRSVITRALGPERDVRVDTERVEARDGDVFLLCSDGLTSMVREAGLLPILKSSSSLEEAGRGLIAAANEAGGRDNITVILFRLEDVDTSGGMGATQVTAEGDAVTDEDEYEDFQGKAAPEPRQGITRMSMEQSTRAGEAAPAEAAGGTEREEEAYKQELATTALPAIPRPAPKPEEPEEPEEPVAPEAAPVADTVEAPPEPPPLPASAPPPGATRATTPPPKRRRRFPWKPVVAVLVVLGLIAAGGFVATRAVFFVGVDDDTKAVTIYRGLPYNVGFDLYSTHYTSGVTLEQIPASRREVFTENKLRSLDDATDLVKQAELGKLNE
jgi:protein phosphatase